MDGPAKGRLWLRLRHCIRPGLLALALVAGYAHTIMSSQENLLQLLHSGQDNALLRFSLGSTMLKDGVFAEAAEHFARAVTMQPDYSAAWKLYGRALAGAGRREEALAAWRQGISVAEGKGDLQAAKEMRVFLRRLEKTPAN